jgi:hypothetical protein
MITQATRADSLRIIYGAAELRQLSAVGTIPGVQVVAVASACGPGSGRLSLDGSLNLTWTPPSGSPGDAVDVSAGGDFLLEDSTADSWLRVHVESDYLVAGSVGVVSIADCFLEGWDISSAQASAGNVATLTLSIRNDSPNEVANVIAWIDPACSGYQISTDGTHWNSGQSEASGLSVGSILPSHTVPCYLRRTIAASSGSNPNVLQLLHLSFQAVEQ